MEVGNQVFPLSNISRVQTLFYDERVRFTAGHRILLVMCVVAVVFDLMTPSYSTYSSSSSGSYISGIAVAVFAVVLIHGLASSRSSYLLVIETSGAQSVTLVSKNWDAIQWLKYQIVGAIENPPLDGQQAINIGPNIHLNGAQGVQIGNGNSQSNDYLR